jgi:hypothetical protein
MEWTKENIQKAVDELIEKAGCDLDFRKSLKADPNKTISDFIDADLPDSFNVNVVDMNDCDMLITLPETRSDEELSDFELEMAAGGKGTPNYEKVCEEKAEENKSAYDRVMAERNCGILRDLPAATYFLSYAVAEKVSKSI